MPLLTLSHPSMPSITDTSFSRKPSVLSSCQKQDLLQNHKSWGEKESKGYSFPGHTGMLDNQTSSEEGLVFLSLTVPLGFSAYPWISASYCWFESGSVIVGSGRKEFGLKACAGYSPAK